MTETRIVGVAMLSESGLMYVLPAPNRHHHVFALMQKDGVSQAVACSSDQGFITSEGLFITREDAVPIAHAAGQIIEKGNPQHMLFSEDVW